MGSGALGPVAGDQRIQRGFFGPHLVQAPVELSPAGDAADHQQDAGQPEQAVHIGQHSHPQPTGLEPGAPLLIDLVDEAAGGRVNGPLDLGAMRELEDQLSHRLVAVLGAEPADEVGGLGVGDSGADRVGRKAPGEPVEGEQRAAGDPAGQGVGGVWAHLASPHLSEPFLEPGGGLGGLEGSAEQDVHELVAEDLFEGLLVAGADGGGAKQDQPERGIGHPFGPGGCAAGLKRLELGIGARQVDVGGAAEGHAELPRQLGQLLFGVARQAEQGVEVFGGPVEHHIRTPDRLPARWNGRKFGIGCEHHIVDGAGEFLGYRRCGAEQGEQDGEEESHAGYSVRDAMTDNPNLPGWGGRDTPRTMVRDRWLWAALIIGLVLRLIPMELWPQTECVRDECIYRYLASGIQKTGVMGVTTKGWLAAPGYPYAMAWSKQYLGSYFTLKWFQVALSVSSIPVIYALSAKVLDGDPEAVRRRAARWAAWLLALHPTVAWYSSTWWIETIYIGFLLPAIVAVLYARDGGRASVVWGTAAGLALGICILFRGVATWLPPMFIVALLWPDGGVSTVLDSLRSRWKPTMALVAAVFLCCAPYSWFASHRYGGFVVSDATVGHVMYLGNNDFPPLTFDYGNGVLTQPLYYRYIGQGRRFCDRKRPPVQSARCDVKAATAWIRQHPGEFVARIPLRLAQQFNPNTFLTRHIRWGYFRGIPWALKELLCLWIAGTSVLIVLGGTLGGIARGRGAYALMAGGTIAYTLFAAAVMYGMSRFRLPLEPLWIVWLAAVIARPSATIEALRASRVRAAAVIATLPILVGLMGWFALTGFPMFWH